MLEPQLVLLGCDPMDADRREDTRLSLRGSRQDEGGHGVG